MGRAFRVRVSERRFEKKERIIHERVLCSMQVVESLALVVINRAYVAASRL